MPGCVHTDLLAARLVPDPYLDENEGSLAWVSDVDWRYETTLTWGAANVVPTGSALIFGSIYATDRVTLQNPLAIAKGHALLAV